MIEVVKGWWRRYFSDEQALILSIVLIGLLFVILSFGKILGPVFTGVVLAFLMQGLVNTLVRWKIPHLPAVILVSVFFMGLLLAFMLLLLPLAWNQASQLFAELPAMITHGQALLQNLPEQYPQFVSEEQIQLWLTAARTELGKLGPWLVSVSLASIPNLVGLLIYLILVPILVFFFLKDRDVIVAWVTSFLPKERSLMRQIWLEMDTQIANYVRGKVIEIGLVGSVSYATFSFMGLNYAALLGILVGLSVIVPYIGAAVVTIPVALVAGLQWGWSADFMYLMIAYGVIQALDGNFLVPFLFSEVVNLHPISIIVAVLFFGGVWGLWGVFFAIPLATLVKAVINAWPRPQLTGTDASQVLVEPRN